MKTFMTVVGLIAGFVIGTLVSQHIIGGGVAAIIGGIIFGKIGSSFGEKAVKAEAGALSGSSRSTGKAIFWWLVLFAIGAAALVLIGLGK